MRAIFAVDPGGHTGVAWSIVNERAPTAIEAMQHRLHRGSATTEGSPMEQAKALWQLWSDFKVLAVRKGCMNPDWVILVFEDFVLRAGAHAGGRDGTWPERVAYAFEGYRHGRFDTYRKERHLTPIEWQMPSAASRFRRRPLLTAADAWVKGREHERSAYSHMILRVNILMDKSGPYTRASV